MPLKPRSKKKHSFWEKLDPFTYVDAYVMPFFNPWDNEVLAWVIYILFSFLFAYVLYSGLGLILQTASPLVIVVSGSMLPTMARGDVVVLQGVDGPHLTSPEVVLDDVDVAHTSMQDLADMISDGEGGWNVTFKKTGQMVHVPKIGTSNIVVYYSDFKSLEIIHRAAIKIRSNGNYFLLTKGDNNPSFDQDCGAVTTDYYPGTASPYISTVKSCPSPYPVPLAQVHGKALAWIPFLGYVKLALVDSWQPSAASH